VVGYAVFTTHGVGSVVVVILSVGVTVKGRPFEVTSPSTTVIVAVPGLAIRLAATWAVNCAALPKAVGSAAPFHCTTAPEAKHAPFTVSVNAAPPAVAELGLSELISSAHSGGLMTTVYCCCAV
jgi:hypothetical protein